MQEPPTISVTLQSLTFPLPPKPLTVKPNSFPIQKHQQSSTNSTEQNLPTKNNTSAPFVSQTSRLASGSFQRKNNALLAQLWQFLLRKPSSEISRIENHILRELSQLDLSDKQFLVCPSIFHLLLLYQDQIFFQQSTTFTQDGPKSDMTYTVLFLLIIFLTSSERASKMFHLHDQQPEPAPIDPFEFPEPVPRPPEHPLPTEGIQLMYYEQYKKIYNTSFRLHGQASKQAAKHLLLSQKIAQIETQLAAFDRRKRSEEVEEITERTPEGPRRKDRKRNRRTAEQIVRRYECPHEYCDRCYGSEGSLQQHLKLKHPELYQREEDEQEM